MDLKKNIDSPVFEDLKEELKKIPVGIDAMYFLYNPEQINTSNVKGYKNLIGKNTEMLKKRSSSRS